MKRDELLRQLESLVEVKPGTLRGPEELSALPGWDSLTQVSFVVIVERAIGIKPTVKQMADCRTVQDLVDIFEKKAPPA
jgi:acyl carrier protein